MQCICEALRMHTIYWCEVWDVMLLLASKKPRGCFDLFLFTIVSDVLRTCSGESQPNAKIS